MFVAGFDWDEGNRDKYSKHGVSHAEIEAVFAKDPLIGPDVLHSTDETRFRAFGKSTSGRAVFVVFTLRMAGTNQLIRPISARYMHAKEIAFYENLIAKS